VGALDQLDGAPQRMTAEATADRALLALQALELGDTQRVPWDIVGRLRDLIRDGIFVWVEEWARHGLALPLEKQRQVRLRDGKLVQEQANAVTRAWTALQEYFGATLRHRRKVRLVGGEVRQDVNVYDVAGLIEKLRQQPVLPFLETEEVPEEPPHLRELEEEPTVREPEKNRPPEAAESHDFAQAQAMPCPERSTSQKAAEAPQKRVEPASVEAQSAARSAPKIAATSPDHAFDDHRDQNNRIVRSNYLRRNNTRARTQDSTYRLRRVVTPDPGLLHRAKLIRIAEPRFWRAEALAWAAKHTFEHIQLCITYWRIECQSRRIGNPPAYLRECFRVASPSSMRRHIEKWEKERRAAQQRQAEIEARRQAVSSWETEEGRAELERIARARQKPSPVVEVKPATMEPPLQRVLPDEASRGEKYSAFDAARGKAKKLGVDVSKPSWLLEYARAKTRSE